MSQRSPQLSVQYVCSIASLNFGAWQPRSRMMHHRIRRTAFPPAAAAAYLIPLAFLAARAEDCVARSDLPTSAPGGEKVTTTIIILLYVLDL